MEDGGFRSEDFKGIGERGEMGSVLDNGDAELPMSTEPAEAIYASLPLEMQHHPSFHHHPHQEHPQGLLPPPQLNIDLDALSHIPLDSLADFSNPGSVTALTDYSQPHSLPSLTHSQDTAITAGHTQDYADVGDVDANEIDFHGGHITMHLGPAMQFNSYDSYDSSSAFHNPLSADLQHLEQQVAGVHQQQDTPFGTLDDFTSSVGDLGGSCYADPNPSKPWHFNDIIERMEGAAESFQMHNLLGGGADQLQVHGNVNVHGHEGDIVRHGVGLHEAQFGVRLEGLWKLQTGFEDTGMGADEELGGRKVQEQQQQLGIWR
jgi:transcriptional enhancer factor